MAQEFGTDLVAPSAGLAVIRIHVGHEYMPNAVAVRVNGRVIARPHYNMSRAGELLPCIQLQMSVPLGKGDALDFGPANTSGTAASGGWFVPLR